MAHRTRTARRTALGVVIALALLIAACGDDGDGTDTSLTVYTGRSEELVGPLIEEFEAETGIDVAARYGDSADLALLIDTEGDQSPADVFLSQSPGATGFLDGQGRLTVLSDEILDEVPPALRSPDGTWVGITGRVRVVVYNTDTVSADELPYSVFDLTDPTYKGRVGIAPANGSFQDFVTIMRASEGDDATLAWLTAMNDNDVRFYAKNSAIVEATQRGEVDFGLVNHYYNERSRAEQGDIGSENHFVVAGDPGGAVLVTAAGIVDTSKRDANATRFIEFLLSESSQRFFASETLEYPIAAGVEPVLDLPPLSEVGTIVVDLDALGGGLEVTRDLIVESGLEAG